MSKQQWFIPTSSKREIPPTNKELLRITKLLNRKQLLAQLPDLENFTNLIPLSNQSNTSKNRMIKIFSNRNDEDLIDVKLALQSMGLSLNGKYIVSLDSIERDNETAPFPNEHLDEPILTSPRSIEACLISSIAPKDLFTIPFSEIKGNSDEIKLRKYKQSQEERVDRLDYVNKIRNLL